MQISPFKHEVRPGVVNSPQDMFIRKGQNLCPNHQGGHIWQPY